MHPERRAEWPHVFVAMDTARRDLAQCEMSREDRLMKAVLSFKLFILYFHLTCLPKSFGISQRFNRTQTAAATFAADTT
jgi:hypothetical protein